MTEVLGIPSNPKRIAKTVIRTFLYAEILYRQFPYVLNGLFLYYIPLAHRGFHGSKKKK